jgi:RNA exonuclease 4
MAFFLSKKQKQEMRERRRKKKVVSSDNAEKDTSNIEETEAEAKVSKKRPRPSDESEGGPPGAVATSDTSEQSAEVAVAAVASNIVTLPADLSAKDSKKARKEARRQARVDGQDENQLEFRIEGEAPPAAEEAAKPRVQKKKKRNFPCINDLVKQDKKDAEKRQIEEGKAKEDAGLTEEYKARYVAMDCEMVGVGSEGRKSALARVSITDWNGAVILDTFVKCPSRVTDFRTWVSGVTAKHLQSDKAMEVVDCRQKVANLLRGKILVGHALKNDLDALLLQHPKQDIRDTAKHQFFQRLGANKWRPRKLKDLALQHLGLKIQVKGESHDSIDDASATMEIFKVARAAWEMELDSKRKKNKLHK